MIRQEKRRKIREIDKRLKTITRLIDNLQILRVTTTSKKERADAELGIKAFLDEATYLFLKRKSLVLDDPKILALHPSDVLKDIPDYHPGE